MEIETDLQNKLKGYYSIPRGRFLLLKNKILTKEEFILYEAGFAFADWDKTHSTYGMLLLTQKEIEICLGFSTGYVSRKGASLIKKGFWIPDNNGIRISGFELIEQRLLRELTEKWGIVDVQKYLAEMQIPVAAVQKKFVDSQIISPKREEESQPQEFADLQNPVPKSDIVSYKDESKFYFNEYANKQAISSEEEYKRVVARVERLTELIGNDWVSEEPRIKQLVQEHEYLAGKMLEYETEHDLIPL